MSGDPLANAVVTPEGKVLIVLLTDRWRANGATAFAGETRGVSTETATTLITAGLARLYVSGDPITP